MPVPAIKFCGLVRPADAKLAAEAGASWLGTILVPESPRHVAPERAREIAAVGRRPLVVVVANLEPAAAADAARRAGAAAIQLHGSETPEDLQALRELGAWELWKAVRVRSEDHIGRMAARWADVADALVLDGWHPEQLGGTGRRFPWEALEEIRDSWPSSLRLVAAGGLTPGNVAEAVRRLRPNAVDTSSGVEDRPGIKNPQKLRSFAAAVRSGVDGAEFP